MIVAPTMPAPAIPTIDPAIVPARGLLDTEKHRVLIRDAEQLMDIAEGFEDLDD